MKQLLFMLGVGISITLSAQQQFELKDMSEFRDQSGNWSVVSEVSINPDVDVHHKPTEEETGKKKKKKSKEPAPPEAVTFEAGTGVLLNMNDDTRKTNIQTVMEHGDIWLELEVMLPKGSNSGLYLQGRYEVQLYDSWGVKQPKFSDIGGIYRNWESAPDKKYMGKAPISNPALAPGLWQKFEILFTAPRFDADGNKTANARLEYVDLNGVRIHSNVEIPKYTGGPISKEEAAMGPIMIQGDHGPVAIRNFKYKLLGDAPVALSGLEYKEYKGRFASASEFLETEPINEGSSKQLTCEVLENDNNYLLVYTGNLVIGEEDEYELGLGYQGGAKMTLAGEPIFDRMTTDGRGNLTAKKTLKAGTYPIEIQLIKTAGWRASRLGLTMRGSETNLKKLHAYGSYPDRDNVRAPINLEPRAAKTIVHRGFSDFYKGESRTRLSHSAAVGHPNGINYVFDLKTGNMVTVWRGDFVDATPMWNSRGDGSFRPRGAAVHTFLNQPIANLSGNESFPQYGDESYKGKGYRMDESGQPTFLGTYQGLNVETSITPDEAFNYWNVQVKIEGERTENLKYKLAEGSEIERVDNGYYAIDGRRYYIDVKGQAEIREVNGIKELIVPVTSTEINYSIIW